MEDLAALKSALAVAEKELEAAGIPGSIVVSVDKETFLNIKDRPDRQFLSTGRVRLECVVSDVTFRV